MNSAGDKMNMREKIVEILCDELYDAAIVRIAKLEEGLTTISSCVQQWQDHPKKSGTEIFLELIKDTCDESLERETQ
jgi:hypothetical protein